MTQFALYEQMVVDKELIDSFHYIGSVNSHNKLQNVLETHKDESDGKIRVIPLNDYENIPYQFSDEDEIDEKCEMNSDLLSHSEIMY